MFGSGAGLLAAGGIGAALTAAFSQIRSFIQKIRSLIIGVAYFRATETNCMKWVKFKKGFNWGDRYYEVGSLGREVKSTYLDILGKTHIRFLPSPVLVSWSENGLKIVYIKGTLNPDIIAHELFDMEASEARKEVNSFYIENEAEFSSMIFNVTGSLGSEKRRYDKTGSLSVDPSPVGDNSSGNRSGWNKCLAEVTGKVLEKETVSENHIKPFDGLAYEEDVLSSVKSVENWLKLKRWYNDKGISWKRGLLLYGKPGTGKTSLVRAIANKYALTVFSFQLSTFKDDEFHDAVFQKLRQDPQIFLFEDADISFELRKSNTQNLGSTPLTLSTFLNTIDGIEPLNGVFVIVTTNCIDKLDAALLRPGRLDEKIELKPLSQSGKAKIADYILGDWPEEVKAYSGIKEEMTGAEFKEICIKRALEKKWENQV